jgi:hypothetical protein
MWRIAKSLTRRSGPKAPSVIHDPLGSIFYPIDKLYITADCLENQFTPHGLCDYDNKLQADVRVYALLATVDEDIPVEFRPFDVSKEIQYLKLGKACGFDGIQNECLRRLP